MIMKTASRWRDVNFKFNEDAASRTRIRGQIDKLPLELELGQRADRGLVLHREVARDAPHEFRFRFEGRSQQTALLQKSTGDMWRDTIRRAVRDQIAGRIPIKRIDEGDAVGNGDLRGTTASMASRHRADAVDAT